MSDYTGKVLHDEDEVCLNQKKKRTMFSSEQKSMLEAQFLSNPYPDKSLRKRLADDLSVKDKSIDYWFGHRRAKNAKAKKAAVAIDGDSPSPLSMDSADTPSVSIFDSIKSPVTIQVDVEAPAPSFVDRLHVPVIDYTLQGPPPKLSDFDDCLDIFRSAESGQMSASTSFDDLFGSADSLSPTTTSGKMFSDILDGTPICLDFF